MSEPAGSRNELGVFASGVATIGIDPETIRVALLALAEDAAQELSKVKNTAEARGVDGLV